MCNCDARMRLALCSLAESHPGHIYVSKDLLYEPIRKRNLATAESSSDSDSELSDDGGDSSGEEDMRSRHQSQTATESHTDGSSHVEQEDAGTLTDEILDSADVVSTVASASVAAAETEGGGRRHPVANHEVMMALSELANIQPHASYRSKTHQFATFILQLSIGARSLPREVREAIDTEVKTNAASLASQGGEVNERNAKVSRDTMNPWKCTADCCWAA